LPTCLQRYVVFYGAILIYTIYFEYVAVGQQIYFLISYLLFSGGSYFLFRASDNVVYNGRAKLNRPPNKMSNYRSVKRGFGRLMEL